jgi:hypothetical protein
MMRRSGDGPNDRAPGPSAQRDVTQFQAVVSAVPIE